MTAAGGLILAAPSSGSGKTLATLGLLAHLTRRGVKVASVKVGPDYIDPAFHAAATGRDCFNLDAWAMRPDSVAGLVGQVSAAAELVVCEGVMGLFDGADVAHGEPSGSTADLAALTGWPVVLLIDGRGMTGSAAAVLLGFAGLRPDIRIKGVIFNRVSGDKHKRMITEACRRACPDIEVLGFLPRLDSLMVPSRHLGLVQACEHPDLAAFLSAAAQAVGEHIAVDRLMALARPSSLNADAAILVPPLGQRMAVAQDAAFAFAYPALLDGWRRAGAEISLFSPLADEAPVGDAVYLPGGYPELHAGRLAGNQRFLGGLRSLAASGAAIFGECGGYMVLGNSLTDADGHAHAMAGLLGLDTSFAQRRLHLGYRQARLVADGPLGAAGQTYRGHEFHYATIVAETGEPLFAATDAAYTSVGGAGLRAKRVIGSFVHLIDCAL
ncbi:MAG: cobyrinate a,c-diamide synthase [Rhodospirillaceae bacterium]|nr:cobyrinate a,c-diamide synthase [Rhodospirillales bacterium]